MGPTWGRQDPGGPHVGTMNVAIWELLKMCCSEGVNIGLYLTPMFLELKNTNKPGKQHLKKKKKKSSIHQQGSCGMWIFKSLKHILEGHGIQSQITHSPNMGGLMGLQAIIKAATCKLGEWQETGYLIKYTHWCFGFQISIFNHAEFQNAPD